MKITIDTIEHIKNLALTRENEELSHDDNIELFDSIDCLDLEELSDLYAIAHIGYGSSANEFKILVAKAKKLGFDLTDELLGLVDLGSALKRGAYAIGCN
jgi:hypothetical protein